MTGCGKLKQKQPLPNKKKAANFIIFVNNRNFLKTVLTVFVVSSGSDTSVKVKNQKTVLLASTLLNSCLIPLVNSEILIFLFSPSPSNFTSWEITF